MLDVADVLDLIAGLVDKSLLVAEDRGDAIRYQMLHSIREYAAEKLHDHGRGPTLAARHATVFLDLAEGAVPQLRGAEQLRWLRRLTDDVDNLRAALTWTLAHVPEAALQLAASLRWFWEMRSLLVKVATG